MKFAYLPLAASLLLTDTVAAETGRAEGFLRTSGAGAMADATDEYEPCFESLESFELDIVENATTFQKCKNEFFAAFKDKMEAAGCSLRRGAFHKEIAAHVDIGSTSTSSYINSICQHAKDRQEIHPYSETTRLSPRSIDIAEFYDGRTHLNEEIGSLNVEGAFIKDYYDNHAQELLLELPEIETMEGCRSNSIMCCW